MVRPVDLGCTAVKQSASLSRCTWLFRHLLASAAIALLVTASGQALAQVPISTAAGSYDLRAATWDTSDPRRVCQDFFCNVVIVVPPESVVDAQADSMRVSFNPTILSPDANLSESATATLAGISSNASATLGIVATTVEFGVAATAAKSSVFVGEARAELRSAYFVKVELRSRDLLGSLTAGACAGGCTLAMDFLHQTTGRFAYSGVPGGGARASFSETLSINGLAQASGVSFIEAGPSAGSLPSPGAAGDWSAGDFLAPRSTAAGTEWTFNHFAQITDQRALFFPSDLLDDEGNVVFSGQYLITVEQKAQAGFGAFEYIVGTSTMSADFDDTSSFTPGRLYDPTGVLDLTDARVDLSFVSAVPVPEPATWAMFAAGLAWTVLCLRKLGTHASTGR
jgi:hypothetical protein